MTRRLFLYFFIYIITSGLSGSLLKAQDNPYAVSQYDFIRYKDNKILFFNDSLNYDYLFSSLDSLIWQGNGQVNIVQIGGSHIQGGTQSGHLRRRFQTFYPGLKGSRGFVFPYRLLHSNNPWDYHVAHTGNWEGARSVGRKKTYTFGLSGVSVTTRDAQASLTFIIREGYSQHYDFNRIKIFHNDSCNYNIDIESTGIGKKIETNDSLGYTVFLLDQHIDTLKLTVKRTGATGSHFTLYGVSLESTEPGITFDAIGVNGATLDYFLRCTLFTQHLKALAPDLVIISLGTNDAYTYAFSPDLYEARYNQLLTNIKQAAPDAAILLTVPNDSYIHRRYANKNTEKVKEVIYKLAKEHGCGVWDLYTIMGGFNSVQLWYKAKLTAYDRVHFTPTGYRLVADLLFNAILKAYDQHLIQQAKTVSEKH